jgi:3',5'-cyclic AMP phosphodiesterase CpdA
MKRVVLLVAVAVPVIAAAVYSRQQSDGSSGAQAPPADLKITTEAKNPWTSLKLNTDPEQFQFAIVTDRTGGHRAQIFSRAVQQVNLLQPEFVMSVGDLIEGYTSKEDRIDNDWKEFQGYVDQLEMPFFYVPGNHDLASKELIEAWNGRYGRKYYHCVYKNVLFLAVNSEDPPGRITEEQQAYFKKALAENPNVRWTLVFMHRPMWVAPDLEKNGWAAMEKLLAGRKYTVFCGHIHHYRKFVRNGMNYYQLATTGGGSRLRGVKFGEFDQIAWITMKKDGPRIANVLLDGVYPEDLKLPQTDEKGVPRKLAKTYPLKGRVTLDGQPVVDVTVRFYRKTPNGKRDFRMVTDGVTNEDGTFLASTYTGFDGIPAGDYYVTVVKIDRSGGEEAKNQLPQKYSAPSTTPVRFTAKDGDNSITIDLKK